jgi:hypothetical protein
VANAAETPTKHNVMIWNAAIYLTLVLRNIAFVQLCLTVAYGL